MLTFVLIISSSCISLTCTVSLQVIPPPLAMVTVPPVKVPQLQVEVGRQLVSSSPCWLSWQWLLLLHASSTREKEGKHLFSPSSSSVQKFCTLVPAIVNSFFTLLTCRQYVMKLVVRFFGSKASEPVRYHKVRHNRD